MLRAFLIIGALFPAIAPLAVLADGTTGTRPIECYCTDKTGQRFELGDMVCLSVDSRDYLARCEMAQNVTTWREIGSDCLSATRPARDVLSRLKHL
jgi:hypothetical protein